MLQVAGRIIDAVLLVESLVANQVEPSEVRIDTATNMVVGAPTAAGLEPVFVTMAPDGSTLYVANANANANSTSDAGQPHTGSAQVHRLRAVDTLIVALMLFATAGEVSGGWWGPSGLGSVAHAPCEVR